VKQRAVRSFITLITLWALLSATALPVFAASPEPVHAENGMVASGHVLASEVGVEILRRGGNAVDAAVATSLALNVVAPYAGVIGGGGFMLIYLAQSQEIIVIDFRERAPADATVGMYLDEKGDVVPDLSTVGYKAVAVPGGVAGLQFAAQEYGTMPLRQLLREPTVLAEKGFPVSQKLHDAIAGSVDKLRRDPEAAAILLTPEGEALPAGSTLRQRNLARTLRVLARSGWYQFYDGRISKEIVQAMAANGGLVSADDLRSYRPTVRKPVHGTYRGFDIWSMPPPSSGGIHIVQMLNILESYKISAWGFGSSMYVHHLVETMKLAFADRAEYLGDPAFVDIPVRGLTSKAYATELRRTIGDDARPSEEIRAGNPLPYESEDTTHLSVVDQWGNAVALTQTLNGFFGACVVAGNTGVFLNNEMDDFSAKPGVANKFGLIGGSANAIAPGKAPLSSMSPTIMTQDGKLALVLGSPGGSTIITAVLETIINMVDFGMNVSEAVHAPRIHAQWMPPQIFAEPDALVADVQRELRRRGHEIQVRPSIADVHAIAVDLDTGALSGMSDPRREGGTVGY